MEAWFSYSKHTAQDQKGVVAIIVAISLVALFGITALSVDIGYMMVSRNELQNIADGSALTGARRLGEYYRTMSYADQQNYVVSADQENQIISDAQNLALKNGARGEAITLLNNDIEIGTWASDPVTGNLVFTQTLTQPNAVRVTARRDNLANGPVGTFFARVIGINSYPVTGTATAALTGQGSVGEGDLELPVGISEYFFNNPNNPDYCDDTIAFSPANSPDSCAGWTSYDIDPSNDITVRRICDEVEGYENGGVDVNETEFEFIGGDLSTPTFDALLGLFQRHGYDLKPAEGGACPTSEQYPYDYSVFDNMEPVQTIPLDPENPDSGEEPVPGSTEGMGGCPLYGEDGTQLTYPDGTLRNFHKWETGVVVYDSQDCGNPNQSIKIVGFSDIVMYEVLEAPEKSIKAIVLCNHIDNGLSRGGGGEYGTWGSIPGLVQ